MDKNGLKNFDADLLIIGAGPAGLTAAQYGARAGLDVLILEQLAPGGQVMNIDILENYPGIAKDKSGFDFCQDLHDQAEAFGAKFLMDQAVSLNREEPGFSLVLGSGKKVSAPTVILASGAKHRTLDIPGEEEFSGRGVSYCATCDGPFFKNKKIFVVGGGDAACADAQYLSRLTKQVILIHRRDRFRAQKSLAERVLNNANIEVRFNTTMKDIHGLDRVTSVILETAGKGHYEDIADAVFILAGTVPQSSLAADAKKDESGYIITDQCMASSIPGLFVAGDVRASPFRQVVVAAGEGAIAAHSAASYIETLPGLAK